MPRVLELTYTCESLRGFAESVGYDGPPFVWDERRRFLLMRELDALFFGLYLGFGEWRPATEAAESADDRAELLKYFPTPLDALDHVMGTFPIVARKEEADGALKAFVEGELIKSGLELGNLYPSHATIRAIYSEMVEAARNGTLWRAWSDDL